MTPLLMMQVMAPAVHFLEFPLKMFPVLLKDDPEAWCKESDNQPNLTFFLLFDEDFRKPIKNLTFQSRQAWTWQKEGIYLQIPP